MTGRKPRRWLSLLFLLVTGLAPGSARADRRPYVHARIEGVINPVKERYLERVLAQAVEAHATFVLLSIDTPGGLVTSLEKMSAAIVNAPLPVVGFVEPSTAQATSAGAMILLATDVAAMAPSTRVGAAHPVANGKPLEGALDTKATNSVASLARSLAERRGRPVEPAEAMVRESKSFTEQEAHSAGLVELLATNQAELLRKLEGRALELHGKPYTFQTAGLSEVAVPMSRVERLLDVLADPTLASLLLSLGVLGILYEIASPGIGAGGIVGSISLLLGLLAMSVLPFGIGGLMLLAVGLAAIALEVKVPSHGVLGVGGVIAVTLGALFLVDPDQYFGGGARPSPGFVAPLVGGALTGVLLLARAVRRAAAAPILSGEIALLGREGVAKSTFVHAGGDFSGSVHVDGARWQAVSATAISAGDGVVVAAVRHGPLRLEVEPLARRN